MSNTLTPTPPSAPDDYEYDGPLYAPAAKVYPQSVKGRQRTIKWAVLAIGLAIYYFLPFLRWDRGPNAPSQAVLVDLEHRRFYFFFIELWPQEVYFFTGLLVIASFTLFLMNAVAGRVWCGYLCPQTVWTDLFQAVERWVEGDRRERMLKDEKNEWDAQRIWEKFLKHSMWLTIAWWTGGAWVLYFSDAPTLVLQLVTFEAPMIAYIWIGILTFTTYSLAGWMREQVCLYMCPWPRIQAALTDEHALNVTYRYDRGEPRMSVKSARRAVEAGEPAGDCIDCNQCVAVCPTGVDIRHGAQLGCIQCGLCIDACNTVMEKIGRPGDLIDYDTDVNIQRRQEGKEPIYRLIRARTVLYTALIAVVGGIMLWALLTRSFIGIKVAHERNPRFVAMSDGSIMNAYTINLINKREGPRAYTISVDRLPNASLEAVGIDKSGPAGPIIVTVPADSTREIRLLLSVPHRNNMPSSQSITFRVTEILAGETTTTSDNFFAP